VSPIHGRVPEPHPVLLPRHPGLANGFIALVVIGAIAAVTLTWGGWPSESFWFWASVCLAGELMWVPMPLGNATLSMASACNFAALLLLPPGEAMLAAAGGGLIAETFFLRKPPVRCVFNAAQSALAVGASAAGLHALSGGATLGAKLAATSYLPIIAAALAYTLVNYGSVSAIVSLTTGVSPLEAWRRNFGSRYEQISNAALFSTGIMIAVLNAMAGPLGTVIAAVPLVLAWVSYRQFTRRVVEEEERRMAA
jgi:hypothetical protein